MDGTGCSRKTIHMVGWYSSRSASNVLETVRHTSRLPPLSLCSAPDVGKTPHQSLRCASPVCRGHGVASTLAAPVRGVFCVGFPSPHSSSLSLMGVPTVPSACTLLVSSARQASLPPSAMPFRIACSDTQDGHQPPGTNPLAVTAPIKLHCQGCPQHDESSTAYHAAHTTPNSEGGLMTTPTQLFMCWHSSP